MAHSHFLSGLSSPEAALELAETLAHIWLYLLKYQLRKQCQSWSWDWSWSDDDWWCLLMPIALKVLVVVGCSIRISSQQFKDFGFVKLLPKSEVSVSGLKAAFNLNTFLAMRLNLSKSAQLNN